MVLFDHDTNLPGCRLYRRTLPPPPLRHRRCCCRCGVVVVVGRCLKSRFRKVLPPPPSWPRPLLQPPHCRCVRRRRYTTTANAALLPSLRLCCFALLFGVLVGGGAGGIPIGILLPQSFITPTRGAAPAVPSSLPSFLPSFFLPSITQRNHPHYCIDIIYYTIDHLARRIIKSTYIYIYIYIYIIYI